MIQAAVIRIDSQIHHGKISSKIVDELDKCWSNCRCTCGHCSIMDTSGECVCCKEIAMVAGKIDALDDPSLVCITDHPGFSPVCLNVWILQASYFQYRQEHGMSASPPSLAE